MKSVFRWGSGVEIPIIAAGLLWGCTLTPQRNPVPAELAEVATIPGIPHIRFWGDQPPPDLDERIDQKQDLLGERNRGPRERNFLALSGGGSNGAFGAGLLIGWTEAGDRPEFKIVTGVSAGALIAPFAFLGPDYDSRLREVTTNLSSENVLKRRALLNAITGDAMASTAPLRAVIQSNVDVGVLQAIATEHRRGRVLLIATTNLDSARPVIWNIGRIAESGHPLSLALVHDILLASAAIPGVFPPVLFDVEADGRAFDELHVDGGTVSQVFLFPIQLDIRELMARFEWQGQTRLCVVRNAKQSLDWRAVDQKLFSIAQRSIATLIGAQGKGDLYRLYLSSLRDKIDFNLAYIPESFAAEPTEPFDQAYMNSLFDLGYELARRGYAWRKSPPGFEGRRMEGGLNAPETVHDAASVQPSD